jgi:hypothetical protein
MARWLNLIALAEIATGCALLLWPAKVGSWLLAAALAGISLVLARIAGIALIALGVACSSRGGPVPGMLSYSALVAGYLAFRGALASPAGPLLWPAVGLHVVLTVILARTWIESRRGAGQDQARRKS